MFALNRPLTLDRSKRHRTARRLADLDESAAVAASPSSAIPTVHQVGSGLGGPADVSGSAATAVASPAAADAAADAPVVGNDELDDAQSAASQPSAPAVDASIAGDATGDAERLKANRMPAGASCDWTVIAPCDLRPQTGLPPACLLACADRVLLAVGEETDEEDNAHDDGVHCK